MTIPELLQQLSQIKLELSWDKEAAHKMADQALLDYINDAGVTSAWNDLVNTAATEPTPGQMESWAEVHALPPDRWRLEFERWKKMRALEAFARARLMSSLSTL